MPCPIAPGNRRWLAALGRAGLSGLLAVSLPGAAALADGNPSLLQRIRELLGLQRPLAVGGSRAALPRPLDSGPAGPATAALLATTGAPSAGAPSMSTAAAAAPAAEVAAAATPQVWALPSTALPSAMDPTVLSALQRRRASPAGHPLAQLLRDTPIATAPVLQSGEPTTAAAGRSDPGGLCLLSPWPLQQADGQVRSTSISGAPPIASQQPLAELQILRGGALVWQQRAVGTAALPNPLAWPLPPLQPGETVQLALRPLGMPAGSFTRLQLQRPPDDRDRPAAAGAGESVAAEVQLRDLLRQGQTAEAFALLFRADLEGDGALQPVARAAIASGCGHHASR
ncbi:MAG: hypothetical protein VKJ44_03070 [Synechococcus sp.]|nr:hypothetical protein [Synechococcus sp.]